MIIINSNKIDKKTLQRAIESIKSNKLNTPATQNDQTPRQEIPVEPSIEEYCTKLYRLLSSNAITAKLIPLIPQKHLICHNVYIIEDFTRYEHEQFVAKVYKTILGREANQKEIRDSLLTLERHQSKRAFVVLKRVSKEGRATAIKLLGVEKALLLYYLFERSYLKRVKEFFSLLITLPTIYKELLLIKKNLSPLSATITTLQDAFVLFEQTQSAQKTALENKIETKAQSQERRLETQEIKIETQESRLESQESRVETQELKIESLKNTITQLQEQLQVQTLQAIELKKILTTQPQAPQEHQTPQRLHATKSSYLDDIYLSFENKFRGSAQSVKEKLRHYIPRIKELGAKDILDIGCGRGEWLELLHEHDIDASGIDLNPLMVELSKSHGLNVTQNDAISHLKTLKDESLDVITAFHLVEHLHFETLIALFDESLRTLKSGGVIIYETPNPENLFVGSCSFYTDPTHKSPIPSATLEFLANARGFYETEILKLHPLKPDIDLGQIENAELRHLVAASTTAQDYALIAKKK